MLLPKTKIRKHSVAHTVIGISLLLLLSASQGFSQQTAIDSVKERLTKITGKDRFDALYFLANGLEGIDPKQALEYGRDALQLASKWGDSTKTATLYASLSFCLTSLGGFSEALNYAYLSLMIAERLGNRERIASANSTLGITYVYIGQYSRALEHHLKALRLREELGLTGGIIRTLNNIGIVYHNIGQYDEAIRYYQKAIAIQGSVVDTIQMIRFLHNLGFAEFKRGNFDAAMKDHIEALRLAEKTGYAGGLAYTYFNLGIMYSERKDFSKGLNYLLRSLDYYEWLKAKPGILEVHNALGSAYYRTGNYEQAIQHLERAALLAQEIKAPGQLKSSYESLYRIYTVTGPVTKALRYLKLFTAEKESLFNTTETNKIADLSIKFGTMAQEQEIELLKKENTISSLNLQMQKYKTNFGIIGIGFLVVLILFLFYNSRRIQLSKVTVEKRNEELRSLNNALQEKTNDMRTLSGLLPICANCKKIRNDTGYWEQLEGFISKHSEATFSHGICPDCIREQHPEHRTHDGKHRI